MSRLTKTMLAVLIINTAASVLFLTGIVDVSAAPGLYVVFPLAAIFYGMFLICRMLEKEVVEFDAEHHDHAALETHPHNIEPLHDHDHDHHESIAA